MARPVRLTRRVTFSSGHRYWRSDLTPEQNRALFGEWASPFNHGHNFGLEVTTIGTVNPRDGMVINIKTIDDILQREVVGVFDQRSINDEISAFRDMSPTTENLAAYLAELLSKCLPKESQLDELKLEETATLSAKWRANQVTLTRSYEFAAAHRLNSPELTAEQNVEIFGKCNNAAGHGHNYVLEVEVSGPIDMKSGMMVDLGQLDSIVNEQVVDRYDHKNFNCDLPEFSDKNPTSEVVCLEIFERLAKSLPVKLVSIRLWETARNMFEVRAE
ncbi:MAG: 6-carboxytetrahydropterin synthase [Chthonomonas sp.]|nr:6-carboxytetrahydropterin synthase [Chthonomonas sp.]